MDSELHLGERDTQLLPSRKRPGALVNRGKRRNHSSLPLSPQNAGFPFGFPSKPPKKEVDLKNDRPT